jgi:lipopolysaccharide assembly protein A
VSTEPSSPTPDPAPSPTPAPAPGPRPAPASAPGPRPAPDPGSPQAEAPQQPVPLAHHKIKHTRISGLWVAVVFFAVVLLLLLIFVLQNGQTVDISYFGAHGHLPLGVALLLAAVCGVLLVVLAGTARISQLRAVARKHRRADAQRVAAASAPADSRS